MPDVDVPARLDVAINGRPYKLVLGSDYQRGAPTSQRATVDNSQEATGASIDTGIAWRRSQTDWSGGAGQKFFDEPGSRSTSDRSRFWRSVGVDVWERRQLRMLPATAAWALGYSPVNPTFAALPNAGTYGHLYISTTSGAVRRLVLNGASAPTVASVTSGADNSPMLATDGVSVYAASPSGLYSISGTTATAVGGSTTADHDFVAVVNGRLLAGKTAGGGLFEYSTAGAVTKTFLGAPAATSWKAATGVPKAILVSGQVGGTSTLYRITYDETSGGLNVALTPATDWPDGEQILSLRYHMGWLLIGTSLGLRLATIDESGNVSYGPVITGPGSVYDFSGDGRYVWFTWQLPLSTDVDPMFPYAATSSPSTPVGLGRLDLGDFVQPLQPAFATDLMETAGATAASQPSHAVARIKGHTWFAIGGVSNIYTDDLSLANTAGWIESSLIEFGFEGEKIATDVEIRHSADGGNIQVSLETEDGVSTVLGTVGTLGSFQSNEPIPAQSITSEAHRVRLDFLSNYQAAVLADDPISYWGLQETAGSTAIDTQGLHNGTLTNMTVNQSGPGSGVAKSMLLAAGSPKIDFGDHTEYEFSGDFSLEGWFYIDADEASGMWLAKYDNATGHHEYGLFFDLSSIRAWVYQDIGSPFVWSGITTDGGHAVGWHHLAMVVSGVSVTLYIDGSPYVPTGVHPAVVNSGTRAAGNIGVLHVGGLANVGYRVAALAVYDYALPASSVAAHYSGLGLASFDAAVRRWALRAVPVARTYEVIQVPLALAEQVDAGGEQYYLDTLAEYQALIALKNSREVVVYNELGRETNVVIDEVILANVSGINQANGDNHHFNGTLLVKLWSV